MTTKRPLHRLVGLAAVVAALVLGLHAVGACGLPTPPLAHPSRLATWVRHHDATVVGFAVVRVVALALGWYLLAVVLLQVAARARPGKLAAGVARLVTVPALRRALVGFAGLSFSATAVAVLPAAAATARAAAPRAHAMITTATPATPGWESTWLGSSPLDPAPPAGPDADPATPDHDHTARLRRIAPGDPGTATIRRVSPATGTATRRGSASPRTASPGDRHASTTAPRKPAVPTTSGHTSATRAARPSNEQASTNRDSTTPPSTRRRASTTTSPTATPRADTPGTATLRRMPGPTGSTDPSPAATPPGRPPSAPSRGTKPASAPEAQGIAGRDTASYTVRSGDNFWLIAHDTLRDAWGREPTDAQVEPYWRALVAHNLGRLARPGQPDLIFVGQVFELPPPPALP